MNVFGIIGALLICLVWLDFLRRLDIFEPEKWKFTVMATCLGALFTVFLLIILSFPIIRDMEPGESVSSILLFYTLRVGLLEESAKIIPMILMLYITNELDEPYDYLKFAMCSALGFATVENIMYFNNHGSEIIDKRAYMSVVGHLSFTCCLAYGIVRKKMFKKGSNLFNILVFGFLGILLHGIFDTLLSVGLFGVVFFYLFFYFLVIVLRNMINTTLNFSPWFTEKKFPKIQNAFTFLILGLAGVFGYAAMAISLENGLDAGIEFITGNIFLSGSLIFFIPHRLSGMMLEKGNRVDILSRK
jgi:RsiW-degrading membrane proteinase PrsW (M82 family)